MKDTDENTYSDLDWSATAQTSTDSQTVWQEISKEITTQYIIERFEVWDENTSTFPLRQYLGYYKAIIRDEDIAALYKVMSEFSVKYKFALRRWKTVIQVVLPKDEGSPKNNKATQHKYPRTKSTLQLCTKSHIEQKNNMEIKQHESTHVSTIFTPRMSCSKCSLQ